MALAPPHWAAFIGKWAPWQARRCHSAEPLSTSRATIPLGSMLESTKRIPPGLGRQDLVRNTWDRAASVLRSKECRPNEADIPSAPARCRPRHSDRAPHSAAMRRGGVARCCHPTNRDAPDSRAAARELRHRLRQHGRCVRARGPLERRARFLRRRDRALSGARGGCWDAVTMRWRPAFPRDLS